MAERDPIARWVERVNRLGRELDAAAASMHPSAWHEALAPDRERWEVLARGGPPCMDDHRRGAPVQLSLMEVSA